MNIEILYRSARSALSQARSWRLAGTEAAGQGRFPMTEARVRE